MIEDQINGLVRQLRSGRVNRRQFIQRAAALGLSAPVIAGMLGAPAAMAQSSSTKGLLTVSQDQMATWIRNFNPFSAAKLWPTDAGIYEPMIIYNTIKGEIVPWLATEYAWGADSKTLTFTIRSGVKWSDGQPLTADDVAFTFNMFKPKTADGASGNGLVGTGSGAWDYLSDVKATDETTVVFSYKNAYTPSIYDIGHQSIVPAHVWKEISDPTKSTNDNPIASGPFTVIKTFQPQYWELHKNPTYWQADKIAIGGIRFPAYPTNDAANLATVNGETDWAGNFIPDIDKVYVAKDPAHYHYWFPPTGADVLLYLNTTKKPFDDVNVRKAISMAIDREKIANVAEYGYTHPADATGLSDAYDKWRNADAVAAGDWVKRDVDKANQMLDAAGLTKKGGTRVLADGSQMKYEINVVTGWSDWVSSCQIMAQNLKDVGIEASVKPYDYSTWFDRVQKGQFDISIGWSSGGATPFNFYRGQMSSLTSKPLGEIGTENWQRFVSAEADKLLDQFAATGDEAEQKKIADQLQMIFVQNAPGLPLFPGPQWGEYNSTRFTGFPDKDNPYSLLSTYQNPERLLVLTTIKPVS